VYGKTALGYNGNLSVAENFYSPKDLVKETLIYPTLMNGNCVM